MNGAKDIRSYGYKVGSIPCGKANLITDVPGVKVGHCTVEENGHKTGVTAVIPCDGNVFVKKPVPRPAPTHPCSNASEALSKA